MADQKPKVMLFSPSLSSGGAERVMLNVATGLAEMGYDIDFVVKNDPPQNRYSVPSSLEVHRLEAHKLLETTIKLARRYKESKPDIVISALETLGLASIFAKRISRHKPIVVPSVHTALVTCFRQLHTSHDKRQRAMVKAFYPYADRIVAVSQGVKDEIVELTKVDQSKVSVLYNPVISEEMLASIGSPVEHPWLGSGGFTAIAAGRLVTEKNYPLMLKAVAEARKTIDVRLVVLGGGGLKDALRAQAVELGIGDSVDFYGFVDNPLAFIAKADVFLLTSVREGLGNVLIEALAAGTPAISVDCPTGPREVLEGGKWGGLVPPDDPNALAEAIVQVANGGGIVASRESWSRFTMKTTLEAYSRFIDQTAQGLA